MTIHELIAALGLNADDEIPIWVADETGEPTKKITAQNMANSVKSLASLPNTTEMNDAIAQSTAHTRMDNLFSPANSGVTITYQNATKSGNRVYFLIKATLPAIEYGGAWLINIGTDHNVYSSDFIAINTNGGAYIFYASASKIIGNREAFPAGTYIISGSYAAE